MVARAAALVGVLGVVGGCGGKPKSEDAHGVAPPGDGSAGAGSAGTGSAGSGSAGSGSAVAGSAGAGSAVGRPGATTGDLQIRVEWADVPVIARTSPGRTPCGTPRAPSIAPTTTWGVPDALVIIDGGAAPAALVQVTLADCAVSPRLVVGAELAITSAVDQPAKLALRKRGATSDLAHLADGTAVPVMLPISGHTVRAALESSAVYSLDIGDETAWIASAPGAYVTEANGQLTAHDLAPGKHAVTAWLPPRAGQPARAGHGTATVVAGELAELTVALAP